MARNAAISARITGDNSDFKKSLADSDQAARNWSTRMGSMRQNVAREFNTPGAGGAAAGGGFLSNAFSTAALARMAGGIGAVVAGASMIKKSLDFGNAFRDIVDGFQGLGLSAEQTEAELEALMDLAKNPGVSFAQAAVGSKALLALGYSASEAHAVILALGNALATTGEADEELAGIVESLTKIIDKGEISEKAFVALAQSAPKIRDAFKAMGVDTANDLHKVGNDTRQVIAAVVAELQKLAVVQADFADKQRIMGDVAKFGWQRKMMAVGDMAQGSNFDQNTPAAQAARNQRVAAPPVDQEEAERRRLATLRAAEQERSLRVSIRQAEAEGLFAYDLRLQLDVMTQMRRVQQELGVNREEALQFIKDGLLLEEAQFDVARRRAAADKANADRERQGPRPVDRNDEDMRNERRFNRSVDLKRKYGSYQAYINRAVETPGTLARETSYSGLDAFKDMQNDPDFGKVRTRREQEMKARTERLEKEGKGQSPEERLLKDAVKALDEIAANTAGQSKGKSEPLRRE